MAEENMQTILLPHVLIFPFPAQGHVNSMLTLAQLLARASESFFVTFLNSEHNHRRLLESSPNLFTQLSDVPRFRFCTIADGLPPDHPRSTDRLMDLIQSLDTKTRAEFTEMLADDRSRVCGSWPPISFLIVDGFLPCAMEVGRESGLPTFAFRTISACSMWAYFCIPRLIEAGEIPIKDESDMDRLTRSIPGMDPDEGVQVRMRDLPSMYRTKDPTIDPALTLLYRTTECSRHAHGFILNTLEEIETTT